MATDRDGLPTVGKESGRTVDATSPDEHGKIQYDGPEDVDQLFEAAGIGGAKKEEEEEQLFEVENWGTVEENVRARLPEQAHLDGEVLKVPTPRNDGSGFAYLNENRSAVLQALNDGEEPLDIAEALDLNNSYVYRTRMAFDFLLEDPILCYAFVEDGGHYRVSDNESATDVREQAKDAAVEESIEAVEALSETQDDAGDDDTSSLFDGDEWWKIVVTLIEADREDYARRIASEFDFD